MRLFALERDQIIQFRIAGILNAFFTELNTTGCGANRRFYVEF